MYADIKLIPKDFEAPENLRPYEWDLEINGQPYNITRFEGYIHCIGGKHGYNDYWVWPKGETPTYDNMVPYDCDEPVCWGIIYQPENFVKYSWHGNETRTKFGVVITRNGKRFYSVGGGLHYGIDKARVIIDSIDEHPLELHMRDYDTKCIGRKVWYRSQPAIITSYVQGQGCVMIEPDGFEKFAIPEEFKHDEALPIDDLERDCLKIDIFEDKHIWWFRD